jgi:SPP1 family predicted phage head-tail adaptor
MDAGKLDGRILLSHRTLTQNDFGEEIATYTKYAIVWAYVRDTSGSKRFAAQQFFEETVTEITIRWRGDVLATDHVTVLGRNNQPGAVYEIMQISDIPRYIGHDMLCRRLVP